MPSTHSLTMNSVVRLLQSISGRLFNVLRRAFKSLRRIEGWIRQKLRNKSPKTGSKRPLLTARGPKQAAKGKKRRLSFQSATQGPKSKKRVIFDFSRSATKKKLRLRSPSLYRGLSKSTPIQEQATLLEAQPPQHGVKFARPLCSANKITDDAGAGASPGTLVESNDRPVQQFATIKDGWRDGEIVAPGSNDSPLSDVITIDYEADNGRKANRAHSLTPYPFAARPLITPRVTSNSKFGYFFSAIDDIKYIDSRTWSYALFEKQYLHESFHRKVYVDYETYSWTSEDDRMSRPQQWRNTFTHVKDLRQSTEGPVELVYHAASNQQFVIKTVDCRYDHVLDLWAIPTEPVAMSADMIHATHSGVLPLASRQLLPEGPNGVPSVAIISEYCEIGDVADLGWRNREELPEHFILNFCASMIDTIAFLHAGVTEHCFDANGRVRAQGVWATQQPILHRDIKPANVFLKWDRYARWGMPRIVLGDFGYACLERDNYGTMGTPGYSAPEVDEAWERHEDLDERVCSRESDMHAFGASLYRMITGLRWQHGRTCLRWDWEQSPLKHREDIYKLVSACLEYDPRNRPSIWEFLGLSINLKKELDVWYQRGGRIDPKLWEKPEEHDPPATQSAMSWTKHGATPAVAKDKMPEPVKHALPMTIEDDSPIPSKYQLKIPLYAKVSPEPFVFNSPVAPKAKGKKPVYARAPREVVMHDFPMPSDEDSPIPSKYLGKTPKAKGKMPLHAKTSPKPAMHDTPMLSDDDDDDDDDDDSPIPSKYQRPYPHAPAIKPYQPVMQYWGAAQTVENISGFTDDFCNCAQHRALSRNRYGPACPAGAVVHSPTYQPAEYLEHAHNYPDAGLFCYCPNHRIGSERRPRPQCPTGCIVAVPSRGHVGRPTSDAHAGAQEAAKHKYRPQW